MSLNVGRNDPCPCGSGRKYKHCHAAVTRRSVPPEESTWLHLRRALEGYPAMMLRFVDQVYGPDAIHEAWDEFTLWDEDEPEFDPRSPQLPLFMPWFHHLWSPDPTETCVEDPSLHGVPPTAALLQRRRRRLDPLLQRYLEACRAAPLGFHEILRCESGHGFRVRDVFTGEELEVTERSASRTMRPGDILFAQFVTTDGVTLMEGCGPHAIPPGTKLGLLDLRERIAPHSVQLTREELADWDIELREHYFAIMEGILNPTLPRLQNTDGEAFLIHRLSFDIDSAQTAFDALKELALDHPESDLLESAEFGAGGALRRVSIPWIAAGNRLHPGWENTVLGQIEIDGTQLVAEVNSVQRATRLQSIITEALGEHAIHRETERVGMQEAMARRSSDPDRSADHLAAELAEQPEVRERIREMMFAHYDAWVTQEIPALAGLTPLEAVRSPSGREKVEALLAQIDRDGERASPPLDPAVLRRVRERLGLV
jgi:hypothetical protein